MALARVQYESDGSTTVYSIPFPYINRDDIKVSIDGTETQDFVFLDGSTIDLDTAPALGEIIDVVRETERTDLLVEFNDGSTLLESDLTLAAQQSFYIAQEAFDQTGSTLAVADDGSYSASDRRISLMGYPTQQQDAANKQYVDDIFAQGEDAFEQAQLAADSADTAISARDAAQAAEATTLNYRNTAEQHKIDAAASASAASTSETNAADSATAAQASEDDVAANAQAAQDAEDLALAHRDDAAASASAASTSETNANDSAVSADNDAAAASNSASNAATSETNAQTYRDQAQSSASAASTSETNAATSASAASTSETNAATSETNAADSADDAEAWASSLDFPSAAGNGRKMVRQATDESGWVYTHGGTHIQEDTGVSGQVTKDPNLIRHVKITLTGNTTLTLTDMAVTDESLIVHVEVTQDNTGNYTLDWDTANIKFPGGVYPDVSTAANVTDFFEFVWNGSVYVFRNYLGDIQ